MTVHRRPLARILLRRLGLIAAVIVVLNMLAVGAHYGSDRRALEVEVVADIAERIGTELDDVGLPADAPSRIMFREHPQAYALALVDRRGAVLDAMNLALIPPSALDLFADDWITAIDLPTGRVLYAGHEFQGRDDGLRLVFVMAGDPENLLTRAFLSEFRRHVWIPVLPMALLLITASVVMIRRELAPIAAAADWARAQRPGATTPPPAGPRPSEVADLVDATERALDRLNTALAAETRHSADAAHALRTQVAVLMARVDALPPGKTTDQLRTDIAVLARTVQQVLAASRTDVLRAGEETMTDLREPAQAVAAGLAPFAYERGVELSLAVPDSPVPVHASREAVELALTNLVENAVLHGGAGLVEITVGPGPTIAVRDHGPGLAPGVGRQALMPFWRASSAPPGGTGLGLAIVDRLQRTQSGHVDITSPDDGGCKVTLGYRPAAG